jgi:hypothetical protein
MKVYEYVFVKRGENNYTTSSSGDLVIVGIDKICDNYALRFYCCEKQTTSLRYNYFSMCRGYCHFRCLSKLSTEELDKIGNYIYERMVS